ncbi:N-formylglutamate amidohydrolase [Defluviimonas denitrificans]|uniref:N-formylglutamate amidohydrolase n=1 Tax=Albidovulum denitrificans TaxID=404881 RepID=A0A2S8S6W9_9RHOB|nr:N-formylglutamate amidohydrolase [Defluviimonas denitrificans]PQV56546.1 N-formylglutamate amidohydrolase [Defluviimonas denitrificans]
MAPLPYDLTLPDRHLTSVIFSSPHSGRDYPSGFVRKSVLDERTIRSSEDAFIDDLLDCAPSLGAPLLAARCPRAYVDLNRGPDELDPAVIEGLRPAGYNPRVSSGLGVIPRVVAGGKAIYRGKLSPDEVMGRIDDCWTPYHDCLKGLIAKSRTAFGEAILLDMHSMPHEAVDSIAAAGARRPEIILGDRFGAAASSQVVDRVEAAFEAAGLRTLRNAPFAGAYIAQQYGRPAGGTHVIQIEIDRALYMNEREIRPNGNYKGFKKLLAGIVAEVIEIGRPAEMLSAAE